jgi:hypothetical protein
MRLVFTWEKIRLAQKSANAVNFFIIVVPPNTNSNLVDSSTCNSDKTSNLPDFAEEFVNVFNWIG